jgi:hypothetical protein
MKKKILLTSMDEPSDEQLSSLMKEVAQEAKRKALLADQQLRDIITRGISQIQSNLTTNAQ